MKASSWKLTVILDEVEEVPCPVSLYGDVGVFRNKRRHCLQPLRLPFLIRTGVELVLDVLRDLILHFLHLLLALLFVFAETVLENPVPNVTLLEFVKSEIYHLCGKKRNETKSL